MALLTKDARAAVLAAAGLEPGPAGYDLDQLDRCARARGWSWTSTPATTYHGRPGKWKASVFVPAPTGTCRPAFAMGSRGAGRSEAEALEKALATALARER